MKNIDLENERRLADNGFNSIHNCGSGEMRFLKGS